MSSTTENGLAHDRLELKFNDFKPALDATEAQLESARCINCYDAPCIQACPTTINIPQFISRIASQNTRGAAKTILDSNIMGLSCAQSCPTEVLCEGACVYHSLNKKPIQIGKLQRFAVEYAYENQIQFYQPGQPTGKKVALIGAGPASLACAHELRKYGHEAVIFEKTQILGGLNTTGIAPYKMKAQTSLREIEEVKKMGVRFELGQELGKNLKIDSLLKDYDTVFLGLGLGPDSRLKIEGIENSQGAVDFIAQIKTAAKDSLKSLSKIKSALIVGGGNTALDACRELKGLGIEKVVVSYRKDEASMSGYKHELNWAKQENVEFWFNTVPVAFKKSGDAILAKIQKTNSPTSIALETLEGSFDLVLMATGQSKLESLLTGVMGLKFENGVLITDSKTGQTGHSHIFAGGDLSNGGKEVVNAVAEGKRAALAIHKKIGGAN